MAAYAALVSLMNTIHHIQNHPRYSFSFDNNQIGRVSGNAQFFLQFVESFNTSHTRSEQADDLEIQIASVACLAENLLESYAVNQILAGSSLDDGEDQAKKSPIYSFDLESVVHRMDSVVGNIIKVKEESRVKEHPSIDPMSSSRLPTVSKTSMVGFDGYMLQLMDLLTGQRSTRQIISVVGMGGIGKTTLTRNVYENSTILQHFDVRAWVVISQDYDIKEVLLQLLDRKGESAKDTCEELGEQLHKKLWGRRYLIILDDMWSTQVWDRIRLFLPDNGNRSRIVVTSRISNVSTHLTSSSLVIDLLDDNESWKLFCATTFGEEECPHDLVEIGKNIVGQCKGLPLSIVVIGGHLRKSLRIKEQWDTIARNMMSFLDSGDDRCLSILSLSYTHLPACLKPCFLYMGVFVEDEEIHVPTLIRVWVAEGFLQPDGTQSSEETAESNLKHLIDRNLILVQEQSPNGNILRCKVHDLVRELCLKVGKKERFLCVLKSGSRCKYGEGAGGCEICRPTRFLQLHESRLLRILPNIESGKIDMYGNYVEKLFDEHHNLRYVSCILHWNSSLDNLAFMGMIPPRSPYIRLPLSISLCWSLQTLVIRGVCARKLAPSEIWEMSWLRHLDIIPSIHLPYPPKTHFVMQSLQTLCVVENLMLSEDVCRRVPNIKELQIYYDYVEESSEYCPDNLCCFHNLESLSLEFSEDSNWRGFARKLAYPTMLRELSLGCSGLHWKDLSMIGSLPHLEVFTFSKKNSIEGREWSPVGGEFLRLKFLTIHQCEDLVCWNAESSHFPLLESLTLGNAYKLMEFPSDIGEIPTLRRVKLDRCSVPAAISAIRMLVEQEQLGNQDLRLEIHYKKKEEMERVKEMVQEEGIESNNLFLNHSGD